MKKSTITIIVVILLVVASSSVGVYVGLFSNKEANLHPTPTPTNSSQVTVSPTPSTQESVSIQGIQANANTLTILAKSTSGQDITITGAILKDASGNTLGTDNSLSTILPASGTLTSIIANLGSSEVFNDSYSVTLISANGTSFDSPVFGGTYGTH